MAKGDRVIVLLDIGQGQTMVREITATVNGQKVSFERQDRKNLVVVEVLNMNDRVVRTHEFRADRVISVEDVPA